MKRKIYRKKQLKIFSAMDVDVRIIATNTSVSLYIRTRSDMLELTRNEYDLVIMAQIQTTHMGGQTVGNKRQEHERQRDTYNYSHIGFKVMLHVHVLTFLTTLIDMQ